jgi:hypothetical protein
MAMKCIDQMLPPMITAPFMSDLTGRNMETL